jgi:hypothetical protein
VRIELGYGSGPRPVRATAYLQGQRDAQLTVTPSYDQSGRVSRVQVVTQSAGSAPVTIDVSRLDALVGAGFFRFSPPKARGRCRSDSLAGSC